MGCASQFIHLTLNFCSDNARWICMRDIGYSVTKISGLQEHLREDPCRARKKKVIF